jgi:hypothetical protein
VKTTPSSIARLLLLVLACLALPVTASAQDVPVVTEDQIFTEDRQGETITIPIEVKDLDQVDDITSYQFDLDFGTTPLRFVEFDTTGTLTGAADFNFNSQVSSGVVTAGGASFQTPAIPLQEGGDAGVLVTAIFEVAESGTGTAQFPADAFSFNGGNVPANLEQADFTVAVGASMTVNEARMHGPGIPAILEGTVTRAFGAYLRLQDESGPTGASGLTLRQVDGSLSGDFQDDIENGTIVQGTELTVRGTLSERGGLLVIDGEDLVSYSVTEQGALPSPQPVSLPELEGSGGTDYESELLRIEGLSFVDPGATGGTLNAGATYTVVGGGGTAFDYRVGSTNETDVIGAPIPEGSFTYEGVLGRSAGGFALVPVRRSTGLPVEMAGFTATATESGALLEWSTASETGNAGFEVQHQRPDATGFSSADFVEGAGTTTSPQRYEYRLSGLEPGTHRFRLQQRDTDGATSLTDPVTLSIKAERALTFTAAGPNPVRQKTQLAFTVKQNGPARVNLYNLLGQQVRTLFDQTATVGERYTIEIDASGLSNGTYFAQLAGPSDTRTRQIVVVR